MSETEKKSSESFEAVSDLSDQAIPRLSREDDNQKAKRHRLTCDAIASKESCVYPGSRQDPGVTKPQETETQSKETALSMFRESPPPSGGGLTLDSALRDIEEEINKHLYAYVATRRDRGVDLHDDIRILFDLAIEAILRAAKGYRRYDHEGNSRPFDPYAKRSIYNAWNTYVDRVVFGGKPRPSSGFQDVPAGSFSEGGGLAEEDDDSGTLALTDTGLGADAAVNEEGEIVDFNISSEIETEEEPDGIAESDGAVSVDLDEPPPSGGGDSTKAELGVCSFPGCQSSLRGKRSDARFCDEHKALSQHSGKRATPAHRMLDSYGQLAELRIAYNTAIAIVPLDQPATGLAALVQLLLRVIERDIFEKWPSYMAWLDGDADRRQRRIRGWMHPPYGRRRR